MSRRRKTPPAQGPVRPAPSGYTLSAVAPDGTPVYIEASRGEALGASLRRTLRGDVSGVSVQVVRHLVTRWATYADFRREPYEVPEGWRIIVRWTHATGHGCLSLVTCERGQRGDRGSLVSYLGALDVTAYTDTEEGLSHAA